MAEANFDSMFAAANDSISLDRLEAYYRGAQPLNFLHPDLDPASRNRLWSLVVNWPRLVLSSIEERLDVEGFRMGGDQADDDLQEIWQANNMDVWSQQGHLDALLFGRSFAMIWPDKDDPSIPRITIESAKQVAVEYDPTTRKVKRAAKQWTDGDERYLTVYSPTTIDRYVSQQTSAASEAEWRLRTDPVPNVYGVVPVVPLLNRPRLTRPLGESELTDIIPLADAINKLATDMMVAAEFHAMPRRWATGITIGDDANQQEMSRERLRELWSLAGADRVWTSDDPTSTFGQFTEANLSNFISGMQHFAMSIAAITGLPPHYLGIQTKEAPSADALRASEASLVHKAKRKQRVFGGAWEDVMRIALLIKHNGELPDEAKRMETIWRDPETPALAQGGDRASKLVAAAVIDAEQAQEDLGYTSRQMKAMADRKVTRDAEAEKKAAEIAAAAPVVDPNAPVDPAKPAPAEKPAPPVAA